MNCFSVIINEGVSKKDQHTDVVKVAICVRFFGILVKNTVKKFNKEFLADNYKTITKFWKEALNLPSYYFKKNSQDLPKLEEIELEMQGFFQEYTVKLNEE